MLNRVILYLNVNIASSISEVYTFERPAVRETLPPYLCFYISLCWSNVNSVATISQAIFSQNNSL